MKKLIIALIACSIVNHTNAQFLDRIKNKVQQKVNDKIDESIDKATEPKKKDKDKDKPASQPPANSPDASTTGKAPANGEAGTTAPKDITAYSRFDFVPGEKIIMEESFAKEPVGEFPGQWNTRSGAEIVTVSNRPGKWLSIRQDGVFYPENITNLPDNFTLQADFMASNGIAGIASITLALLQTTNTDDKFSYGGAGDVTSMPSFKITMSPKSSGDGNLHYSSNLIGGQYMNSLPLFNVPKKNAVRVSIWRQKQRVRVYLDSTKILDLPRALDAAAAFNTLAFSAYAPDFDKQEGAFYVSNIRLAVGAPDTRNKLLTEGKFTTHGILFPSNSDIIQPESYGALKDIAAVLTENPAVKVNIVGHTDADGNDQLNLELSKKRAAAVKNALVSNFNIDAARMETNGKGKTQPIDNNNTETGKANNRRVEFIKI
ncbi:OmpA family protein [Chitinophaga arvensicola]|uniref:OmpA family protein n=1 Tax=Chitinophaga arvensicola TaxID=29529 RepID=A0A1I0S7J6_9BACT|nr:OmpA family protein [Chitinophaga arvensicola]SEW51656.1 OmpA family protein [Chitinophaga arvensicola]